MTQLLSIDKLRLNSACHRNLLVFDIYKIFGIVRALSLVDRCVKMRVSCFLCRPAQFENISKLSQDSQSNFKYNC